MDRTSKPKSVFAPGPAVSSLSLSSAAFMTCAAKALTTVQEGVIGVQGQAETTSNTDWNAEDDGMRIARNLRGDGDDDQDEKDDEDKNEDKGR